MDHLDEVEDNKAYANLHGSLGKYKGRTYNYPLMDCSDMPPLDSKMYARWQEMKIDQTVARFISGNKLHKIPAFKYPHYTHRVTGRKWPGEHERRERKTKERKNTRMQATMLARFMLFNKGKFIPGKLI